MTDNSINKEHVEAHTVQRYRFIVLGSNPSEVQSSSSSENEISTTDPFDIADEAISSDIPKILIAEESGQHLFVVELLKKTDELKTNGIKLSYKLKDKRVSLIND